MFGRVEMLHRPLAKADVMQLNCEQLVADLEATGGLDIWLRKNPPKPRVIAVRATSNDQINRVRLISGSRQVLTDSLTYLGTEQAVILQAKPGRYTYIIDANQPTSYPAETIRWDLIHKKIQVSNQGPVRSTIGQ